MRNRPTLAATLAACFFAAACGKGSLTARPTGCDDDTPGASFVTWNTAMGAHGMVPMASLRAPHVVAALAAQPFDVACLQEVWTPGHAAEVAAGLGLRPDQAFYFDTSGMRESGKDVCTEAQLDGVAECARKECGDAPAAEEVSICVRKECAGVMRGLYVSPGGPECVNCLVAMAGKPVEEIGRVCASDGASRIQDGGSSAMLVSRSGRLYGKEPMLLPSSGSNRTALFATVRVPGAFGASEEIEVACTHVSASAEIRPAHSGYADWDGEKVAQVLMIVARLEERAARPDGSVVPMVLLGDLNAGPDSGAATWHAVLDAGFACPTADPYSGGGCTSCGGNALVGGDRDAAIDHVCFRNPPKRAGVAATCVDRLFDAPVRIAGYGGEAVETDLSDHYAKRVFLTVPPPAFMPSARP